MCIICLFILHKWLCFGIGCKYNIFFSISHSYYQVRIWQLQQNVEKTSTGNLSFNCYFFFFFSRYFVLLGNMFALWRYWIYCFFWASRVHGLWNDFDKWIIGHICNIVPYRPYAVVRQRLCHCRTTVLKWFAKESAQCRVKAYILRSAS